MPRAVLKYGFFYLKVFRLLTFALKEYFRSSTIDYYTDLDHHYFLKFVDAQNISMLLNVTFKMFHVSSFKSIFYNLS